MTVSDQTAGYFCGINYCVVVTNQNYVSYFFKANLIINIHTVFNKNSM